MVKKIIACSDIHIHNLVRQDECQEMLTKFINECKKIAEEYGSDSVRIVIAGDVLHNKLDISSEGYLLASWLFKQLDEVAKTIVIAGNHDLNMRNLSRLDPMSVIFSLCKFKQVYYLDKELDYASGCMKDDNIEWCLYSTFDNFSQPNIPETKIKDKDATYVGLYHGTLQGAKTPVGYTFDNGIGTSYFEGIDFGILGHIHKRQCLMNDGVPLVYCGSLIQQQHGESVTCHGYTLWDVESCTYKEVDIPNETYGYYTFSIKKEDDIDNNLEEVVNL